jgi:hypothetical protein
VGRQSAKRGRTGRGDSRTRRRASGLGEPLLSSQVGLHLTRQRQSQLHHLPTLLLHPSRRLRLLTTNTHSALLALPLLRTQLLFTLRETASSDQSEAVLGTWCLAAHDADRPVAAAGKRSWVDFVSFPTASAPSERKLLLNDELAAPLLAFVQRTALDPAGVHTWLNPPPPVVASLPTPAKKGARPVPIVKKVDEGAGARRAEEDEEALTDRNARLRIGALGALVWLIGTCAGFYVPLFPHSWSIYRRICGCGGSATCSHRPPQKSSLMDRNSARSPPSAIPTRGLGELWVAAAGSEESGMGRSGCASSRMERAHAAFAACPCVRGASRSMGRARRAR